MIADAGDSAGQGGRSPFVSIIMNGFNSARYLAAAVDSVIAQSYRHWEIVFWDNRSEDDSESIVLGYDDPRIRFFCAPRRMPRRSIAKDG